MAITTNINPIPEPKGTDGSSKLPANLDSIFRLAGEGASKENGSSRGDSYISGGFKTNYESVNSRALRDEAWGQFATGDGLFGSELLLTAAYAEREDLIKLKDVRIEAEAWLRNPANKEEAKKIGKYGLPDALVEHLRSTNGVDIATMYQAIDDDMTISEINKLIEKTYRLEANSKEMQKTQLAILAWIIQDNRESLKLSSSSQ